MFWRAVFFFTLALAAFGATLRLYLKDGTYQSVREYQVQSDRVRYFSTERGEWEEIPLDLIDLSRTRTEAAENEASLKADAKAQAEEDAAERAEQKEIEHIPPGPGVYYIHGEKLDPMKVAESKIVSDKKRTVLKVLSPLPIVSGRSTIELDGSAAALRITEKRPEFYFRLSTEESFGIVKLSVKKKARVVESVEKLPVGDEIVEKQDQVDTFKKQADDLLFKIWPEKDLPPGEYALVEFTEGKANPQVWDFGVGPAK